LVHLDEITRWNINHKYGKCYGSVLAVLPCHWPVVQIDSTGKKIGLYHLWKMGSGTLLNKAWNLGTAMYSNNKLNHSWSVKPLRRLHKHALTGISITEFYSYFPLWFMLIFTFCSFQIQLKIASMSCPPHCPGWLSPDESRRQFRQACSLQSARFELGDNILGIINDTSGMTYSYTLVISILISECNLKNWNHTVSHCHLIILFCYMTTVA
jgi:hypothetical protein